MSIDTWAAANGETPKAQVKAEEWFAARPELITEARTAYGQGWSWEQVRQWLDDEHGFPLKDAKSVARRCR